MTGVSELAGPTSAVAPVPRPVPSVGSDPAQSPDASALTGSRAGGERRRQHRLELPDATATILRTEHRSAGRQRGVNLLAVSAAGVFAIAMRSYRGLVHTKRIGTLSDLGPLQVHVGRRDRTAVLDDLEGRVTAVRATLDQSPWASEVPVHGVVCLWRADWGFASPLEVDGVWIGWPKLLPARLTTPVLMDSATVREVSTLLDGHLPPR